MKNWFESLHPNKFAAFADGLLTGAVIIYFWNKFRKEDV